MMCTLRRHAPDTIMSRHYPDEAVENFGPFLVESDLEDNRLFERQNREVNTGVETAYDGLRPPALKHHGETTSRDDEVV